VYAHLRNDLISNVGWFLSTFLCTYEEFRCKSL